MHTIVHQQQGSVPVAPPTQSGQQRRSLGIIRSATLLSCAGFLSLGLVNQASAVQETYKFEPEAWLTYENVKKVQVSHFGYDVDHPKYVTYTGTGTPSQFTLCSRSGGTDTTLYTGTMSAISSPTHDGLGGATLYQGNFGPSNYTFADDKTKTYVIKVGTEESYTFQVYSTKWDNLSRLSTEFWNIHRVGENDVMGNLGQFRLAHMEPAVTWKEGKFKYIGKAYQDGCDGRTYPSVSLVTTQFCALQESGHNWVPAWNDGENQVYEAVRWGLDGAISFLEKSDGLLHTMYVGATPIDSVNYPMHAINTWDILPFTRDEKILAMDNFMYKAKGVSSVASEYDSSNIECIHTSNLISLAYAVALYHGRDTEATEFFNRVYALAKKGYDNIYNAYYTDTNSVYYHKYSLGAYIWLSTMMARATAKADPTNSTLIATYRSRAATGATNLLATQVTTATSDGYKGWYPKYYDYNGGNPLGSTLSPSGDKSEYELEIEPWIYQGLIYLYNDQTSHADRTSWRNSLKSYCKDYLAALAAKNVWGHMPQKVEAVGSASGLARHLNNTSYQYFSVKPRSYAQIGAAAMCMQVGRIVKDAGETTDGNNLIDAAWKQIHWFAGHNPKGYTLINGLGPNNSKMGFAEFDMGINVPGGTMNGACASYSGDANGFIESPTVVTRTGYPDTTGNAEKLPGYTYTYKNNYSGADDMPFFNNYNEYHTYANLATLWFATVSTWKTSTYKTKWDDDPAIVVNGTTISGSGVNIWPRQLKEPATQGKTYLKDFTVRLKGGFEYRFQAVLQATGDVNTFTWHVADASGNPPYTYVQGGNSTIGTITSAGRYTAPNVSSRTQIAIKAVSTKSGYTDKWDATVLTVMPTCKAPGTLSGTPNYAYSPASGRYFPRLALSWSAPASGPTPNAYAIWRRLPSAHGGAIWEHIGSTTSTSYNYPNYDITDPNYRDPATEATYLNYKTVTSDNLPSSIICYYTDDDITFPAGTEFKVTAYNYLYSSTAYSPQTDGTTSGNAAWEKYMRTNYSNGGTPDPNWHYGYGKDSNVYTVPTGTNHKPCRLWDTVPSTEIALSMPEARVGAYFSYQCPKFASPDQVALTYSATSLPPGVSISSTGRFTGTPTTAGTYNTVVTVNDNLGNGSNSTDSMTVPITVNAALTTSTTLYTDAGANDWSYNTIGSPTVTSSNTYSTNSSYYKGTKSCTYTLNTGYGQNDNAYMGWQKVTNNWDTTTNGDTHFTFEINGGTTGGQRLFLKAKRGSTWQTQTVELPPLEANTWRKYSIPLSKLGVNGVTDLKGIWFWDVQVSPSVTEGKQFFVDNIEFSK